MISISVKINSALLLGIIAGAICTVSFASAQTSLTLSVTPTLFEMSAEPGQKWQSEVKVVNSNKFPLTVYAEARNFAPQGESGHGRLIPVFEEETHGSTLGEWIELDTSKPYVIPPEQSKTIPFVITVPQDAAPGGHFAAIMIGTKPPSEDGKLLMKTSQVVSSLFFVRIGGDVFENGRIRTFSVEDSIVSDPQADFSLRFENLGNVHIQPQGQIVVFNMWGKERGRIPINMQTNFGNVLPDSIRDFHFSWEGEASIADIGRYRAEVGLAYGNESKQFSTAEISFWVVPIKPLLITLTVLLVFVLFVTWIIRFYIRRMLVMAGVDPDRSEINNTGSRSRVVYQGDVAVGTYRNISAPIRTGFSDFLSRLREAQFGLSKIKAIISFMFAYRIFFVALVGLSAIVVTVLYYFSAVTIEDKNYQVNIENASHKVSLNSEEVKLQTLRKDLSTIINKVPHTYSIDIVNTSGTSGVAATTAFTLEKAGYNVSSVSYDSDRTDARSVVVFSPELSEEAVILSKILGISLISGAPIEDESTGVPKVTIYTAKDQLAQ